jgi:hypothetical protein
MILSRCLAVAFGGLVATAALIPRIPTASLEVCLKCLLLRCPNLTSILQQPAHIPTAPSAAEKTVRQDSNDSEESAMDLLAGDTMMVTGEERRTGFEKYSEFDLHEKLMLCDRKLGSDPTLISDQSSIGNTSLEDVRYSQCNQALLECSRSALHRHQIDGASWPPYDENNGPTMRTTVLERGMNKCNRVAASNQDVVQVNSHFTDEEFKVRGTIALCNLPLIQCLEKEGEQWEQLRYEWDAIYPYA